MFSLPPEVQLDVLKYLNFNQLFTVKLTHFYFCNLINKYEGELAQIKFYQISIIEPKSLRKLNPYKFIKPQSGNFELTLNDQLKEKWQTAIDKSIPLFLDKFISQLFVGLKTTGDRGSTYILEFPNLLRNIREMSIARCWIEVLFNCCFGRAHFDKAVFNPEMVNILFDNDKTIPLQFNINHLYLSAGNRICENLVVILDNLVISESFAMNLKDVDIPEQYIDILLEIVTNKSDKLHAVNFMFKCELPQLYDIIVEYITTSRECSKIVPDISLHHFGKTEFKLNERAENVEIKHEATKKHTNYQIANIHNPRERFYFSTAETKLKDTASSLWIKKYNY